MTCYSFWEMSFNPNNPERIQRSDGGLWGNKNFIAHGL